MFWKANMLQWSFEHIFPAHWAGLKTIFHATVSTEPFPKVLNYYLIFLIPPLILLCFYFSEHDMKATFLYSFTFEICHISKLWCQLDNFISSPVKHICSTDVKKIFCFTTQFEASYISNWTKCYFVSMPRYLPVKSLKAETLPLIFCLRMMPNGWLSLEIDLVDYASACRYGKYRNGHQREGFTFAFHPHSHLGSFPCRFPCHS